MTTTSFDDWLLANLDKSDYDDVWNLYHSISECTEETSDSEMGIFKTSFNRQQGKYFVTNSCGEGTLMLASDKARATFLKVIENSCCDEMDIEGWYAFHKAMEKDD